MTVVNTQCDAEITECYSKLLVKNMQSNMHPFKFSAKKTVHWAVNSGAKGLMDAPTCVLAGITYRNNKHSFLLLIII